MATRRGLRAKAKVAIDPAADRRVKAATARKAALVMVVRPVVVRRVAAATGRAIAEPRPDHGE
jgi:hypothetical protein